MARVIARVAARIAASALSRDRKAKHQCFRIKNLHDKEIIQLVQEWPTIASSAGLEGIRLLVTDSLDGAIPPHYVSEKGNTITYYRNHNPDGLIYVESSVQSDEQGLQNMFSLRDSNFLDKSFDEYAGSPYGVPQLLIQETWNEAETDREVPILLLTRLIQVIRLIHPDIEPVPVRRFIAFTAFASNLWRTHERIVDEQQANKLVGQALSVMEMFPDELWIENGSEARIKRRLELNSRHAELLDGTTELTGAEVAARATDTKFKNRDGSQMSVEESSKWGKLCATYGLSRNGELRANIPYEIFSQLFLKDSAGLKLGDRVRVEIDASASGRVAEFDALDVTSGLNSRNSLDASRFIEAPPPLGLAPLADLLSSATRKSIERVATPARKQFFNPAIEIVRLVQRARLDNPGSTVGSIEIDVSDLKWVGSPTHGLFSFLFSETLRSISAELEGLPGSCQLNLAQRLITHFKVPDLFESREDSEEGAEECDWDPLPLKFTLRDESNRKIAVHEQMEWLPERVEKLALFWLISAASDSPALSDLGTLIVNPPADGEDWIRPLIYRESSLATIKLDPSHRIDAGTKQLAELIQLRKELRTFIKSTGLELASLRSFLDSWQNLLRQFRELFVPDGARSREFEAFLGTDMLAIGVSERRLMLPVHPIRLRWIACYLEQTIKLAREFLSGESGFADGDGDYYLNWFENLSPREFPPIAIGGNGSLLYSRSEAGWWEDYSPLITNTADVSFDTESIAAVSGRIASYLDAHPYKRDGLSLLVVLPPNDSMPAEILLRIANKSSNSLRVSLHVAAPRNRWESISRQIEAFSNRLEVTPRSRIFPDRDLMFIDYKAGDSLDLLIGDLQFDVAIVTHVLQEQIASQQNTEAPLERPGVFCPLQHRSLRLESGGGGSISLVMLPKYPDPMLESWSTIAVRAHRSRAVAPGQPENTDLVELRINFQDSATLFKDLHHHCHWVITLERHISREQIESIEAGAPDVLSIDEGIGANRQNTIVVSSRSGRELILARLTRKLNRLIPADQLKSAGQNLINELVNGIYESTRRLAPKLALRALGVSRATEEIMGLTIARNLSAELIPNPFSRGVSAWISLDEHSEWFGGGDQVRADMCRIFLEPTTDGFINVDLLVVEGKLRQLYDNHGVIQVTKTCEFFKKILSSDASSGNRNVDSSMWREQIASAIEALPPEALEFMNTEKSDDPKELTTRILSAFRSNPVNLRSVSGVYSACLWESNSENIEHSVNENGINILKSSRFHLIRSIRNSLRSLPTVNSAQRVEANQAVSGNDGSSPTNAYPSHDYSVPASTLPIGDDRLSAHRITEPRIESQDYALNSDKAAHTDGPINPPVNRRGLSEQELRRTYETILGSFASHGISVYAANSDEAPFVEGPASVLYKVRPSPNVDPRKLYEKSAALKLSLELEQDQNINFNIDRGFVTIDVPKSDNQRYFVDASDIWRRWQQPQNSLAVPIGEDRFGNLVIVNFSSPNSPHLLVAGTTGSGKSEALNTILYGLTHHYKSSDLQLILVDPKGTELAPFEDSPYLKGNIGWDDQDAIKLLKEAVEEMQRRYQLFRHAGKRSLVEYNAETTFGQRLPWWVVVLDEYADLTHDPQSKRDIETELKRLAQKARAAGIHVIIATQKPSAEVISTNLRSNLPAQLALRVKSATESRVVIDESGAETLNGKGDALLKADGKLVRVQCARVDLSVVNANPRGPRL